MSTAESNPSGSMESLAKESIGVQRSKLREIIGATEKEHRGSGWEKSWQAGVTPWDAGGVTPVLADLIARGEVPPGRALVPGCGSGYDVLALASSGRQVIGLDISNTAVDKAKRHRDSKDIPAAQADFIIADFFTWEPEAPFDAIFDYTFFCALSPDLRSDWARRMAVLLAPTGRLITLIFPIGDFEGGPPYAVSLDAYKAVLEPAGFVLVQDEPVTDSVPGREGKERLAIWERKPSGKM